jgi:hypothetical protein
MTVLYANMGEKSRDKKQGNIYTESIMHIPSMRKTLILIAVGLVACIAVVAVIASRIKVSTPPSEEITYTNASENDITVELPFPGAVTGKEFSVIGRARGTWFFEASFPIEVVDPNGTRLAIGIATAGSDWMTEEFVPFRADLKVPESYIGPATLVLKKDNPSGMPEKDASISFPFTVEY